MAANFVVEKPSEEEVGKAEGKQKLQTTAEKINAQTKEVRKTAPKQEPKEASAAAQKDKRRDSAHAPVGGAGKPERPSGEDKAKGTGSDVQTPLTEASAASNEPIRNIPKPGKKRPKKLERRSSSKAPA
ncbi:hypothetical protein MPH_05960 [Macrophomina phaseolina MS6]|uniref:Uncharacterized protein n=1 Tax=Macrophomina phaseolina (strain MS6) TaxID=1126212 RepID=K2RVL3_MACPH|nr:hypothetical protein MPH_05960 [Macrophomina phaseolina MS6]